MKRKYSPIIIFADEFVFNNVMPVFMKHFLVGTVCLHEITSIFEDLKTVGIRVTRAFGILICHLEHLKSMRTFMYAITVLKYNLV